MTVTIYMYRDGQPPSNGQVGFLAGLDGCSGSEGPDLWILGEEWAQLGSPDKIKVTVEVDNEP